MPLYLPAAVSVASIPGPLTLAFVGDSITDFNRVTTAPLIASDIRGYGSHATAISNGSLKLGTNLGMSGQDTATIVAALDAWLPTVPEKTVMMFTGANDVASGTLTAAQLFANIMAGVAKIKAAGKSVVLGTILPNGSATTTPKVALRLDTNTLLRAEARLGSFILVEWDDLIQLSDGTIPTNILFDATHPAPQGAENMGQRLYDALRPSLTPISASTWAAVGAAGKRVTNGVMNGTGGSLSGTGASGSVAAGWTGTNAGTGATAVFSKVASTDSDPTPWQQVACTAGSDTQYVEILQAIGGGAGTFEALAQMEIDIPTDGAVLSFHMKVQSFAGGNPTRNHLQTNDSTKTYSAGNRKRLLRIPAITVNATEAGNMVIYIGVVVAATKACTFRVRRVGDLPA